MIVRPDYRVSDMSVPLKDRIALITGASRGIGKGIAIEVGFVGYEVIVSSVKFGARQAIVYVTGRRPDKSENAQLKSTSSLEEVAEEVTRRGGKGIAVYCDHSNPEEVKALFERIEKEQNGQLDVMVNNAYSAVPVKSK